VITDDSSRKRFFRSVLWFFISHILRARCAEVLLGRQQKCGWMNGCICAAGD
jgi:hypothetical protein